MKNRTQVVYCGTRSNGNADFSLEGGTSVDVEDACQGPCLLTRLRDKGILILGIKKHIEGADDLDRIDHNLVVDYDSPMPDLAPTTHVEEFKRRRSTLRSVSNEQIYGTCLHDVKLKMKGIQLWIQEPCVFAKQLKMT